MSDIDLKKLREFSKNAKLIHATPIYKKLLSFSERQAQTIEQLEAEKAELEAFKDVALHEAFHIKGSAIACNLSRVSANRVLEQALTKTKE